MTVYPGQEYLPCDTFEKAMKLVSEGEADLAMIPVEQSNAGRVSDVHFLLPQTGLHIIGEFFLPINHSKRFARHQTCGRKIGFVASAGTGAVFGVSEKARH